jgi:hypothetical protein
MIKKEYYKTRKDGVKLYKTYSDTDHQIINKKTGVVYSEAIDINQNEEYDEAVEYVEIDGVESYEEVLECLENTKNISRKINRLNLTDNEALSVKEVYPTWESKIGNTIEQGFILLYNDNLWRARQTHTALEIYPPSINTAALYEIIEYKHSGTIDDPIHYVPPMEIFEGKYYIEDGILYLCIRNSEISLSHNLKDLIKKYHFRLNNLTVYLYKRN